MTFLPALQLLLIALKLTGHVTASWAWVLLPLWAPFAIVIAALVVAYFVVRFYA